MPGPFPARLNFKGKSPGNEVGLFIEKHAISTELCNVNREKHKLKSHSVCRRDREPGRIPIRSLKSLRNKSRNGLRI